MITDPRFVDMVGRLEHQDDIRDVIEAKLADLTPEEASTLILSKGIPAGPINDISQILRDPQVKEREMFVEMDHPTLGTITVNGCAIKLDETKASVRDHAPALGQDNDAIFCKMLGLSDTEYAEMKEKGVF